MVTGGSHSSGLESAQQLQRLLAARDYIADDALSVSLFLACKLGRPLLLEGAPGVGKTELAKVMSLVLGTDLIRLQCYEGLDLAQAAYEWNYPRQLLEIQARGASGGASRVADLFTEPYLLRRPLLAAIDPARSSAPVLLIDELDRADEEFESFLLELLSDFQITIPELGTLRAAHRPLVLLTSNRTREVHDALKRRCLYHWIDYPTLDRAVAIIRRRVVTWLLLPMQIRRDATIRLDGRTSRKIKGAAKTRRAGARINLHGNSGSTSVYRWSVCTGGRGDLGGESAGGRFQRQTAQGEDHRPRHRVGGQAFEGCGVRRR